MSIIMVVPYAIFNRCRCSQSDDFTEPQKYIVLGVMIGVVILYWALIKWIEKRS